MRNIINKFLMLSENATLVKPHIVLKESINFPGSKPKLHKPKTND